MVTTIFGRPVEDWLDEWHALTEAIEILEDLLEHEREAGEGWKLAAADYYGQTLDIGQGSFELWDRMRKAEADRRDIAEAWAKDRDALARSQAAVAEQSEKIAELHAQNEELRDSVINTARKAVRMVLKSATIRALDNEWERDADFWLRWAGILPPRA